MWGVERIFDMGSVALMFGIGGFIGDRVWAQLPVANLQARVEWTAAGFLGAIAGLTIVAVVLRRSGESVANFLEKKLGPHNPKLAHHLCSRIVAFSAGWRPSTISPRFFRFCSCP